MLGPRLARVGQPSGTHHVAALLVVRVRVEQVVAHVFKNRFDGVAAIEQQRALGCSALSCLTRLAVCAKPRHFALPAGSAFKVKVSKSMRLRRTGFDLCRF